MENNSSLGFKEWFANLLTRFREEYIKLSKEEQSKISNLDDLLSPCQVEVLRFIHPQLLKLEIQFVIYTHFEDRDDLEIEVHTICLNKDLVRTLEGILKTHKWLRSFPDRPYPEETYASILEDKLAFSFRYNLLTPNFFLYDMTGIPWIKSKGYISKEAFYWEVIGDIRDKKAEEIVVSIIEQAKRDAQVQPQPGSSSPVEAKMKGYGTYFYPPIIIGKFPKPSLQQKLFGWPQWELVEKAFDTEYKGHKLVVNRDGFIGIVVDEKKKALKMFNEIMSVALLYGIPSFAVKEFELGEIEIELKKFSITNIGMSLSSPRGSLIEERWHMERSLTPIRRREIPHEDLLKIIKQAEIITEDEEKGDYLIFFLEAYTYFQSFEWTQSLIMSWVIIERYLSSLWSHFLKEKGIPRDRREKLEDWTISPIIESLNLFEKIETDTYREIMFLKRKRDDFLHYGEKVQKEDAQRCIILSESIVRSMCKL